MSYAFRPVTRADLPLLRRWLGEAHVARWWGDPDEQIALIAEDIDNPAMDLHLVLMDQQPIGYLQAYRPHAFGALTDQPAGTHGIDLFVGSPRLTGKGHGPELIGAFCDRLFANGVPRIVTDPAPENHVAIRAYEKAGFTRIDNRTLEDGPVVLMARDRA